MIMTFHCLLWGDEQVEDIQKKRRMKEKMRDKDEQQ